MDKQEKLTLNRLDQEIRARFRALDQKTDEIVSNLRVMDEKEMDQNCEQLIMQADEVMKLVEQYRAMHKPNSSAQKGDHSRTRNKLKGLSDPIWTLLQKACVLGIREGAAGRSPEPSNCGSDGSKQ